MSRPPCAKSLRVSARMLPRTALQKRGQPRWNRRDWAALGAELAPTCEPGSRKVARLGLTLLGDFQARLGAGPPVRLRTRRTQELLATLGLPDGYATELYSGA